MQYLEHVRAVAALLSGFSLKEVNKELNADYYGECFDLVDNDGHTIHFSYGPYNHKKRIIISGSWPQRWVPHGPFVSPSDVNEEYGGITQDINKTPEQVAASIQKRFLPEYFRIFEKCKMKAQQRNDADAAELARKKRFAVVEGRVLTGKEERPGEPIYPRGFPGLIEVYTIVLSPGGIVRMDLRGIPDDKAIRILEILKGRG